MGRQASEKPSERVCRPVLVGPFWPNGSQSTNQGLVSRLMFNQRMQFRAMSSMDEHSAFAVLNAEVMVVFARTMQW